MSEVWQTVAIWWWVPIALWCWLSPGLRLARDAQEFFRAIGNPMPHHHFMLTWLLWPWVLVTILHYRARREVPAWAPWWVRWEP